MASDTLVVALLPEATLRLDQERMDLIAGFMDTYLALSAKEELAFGQELNKIEDKEQMAAVMELMTSWERKGRAEGWQEGQSELIKLQLKCRFGALSPLVTKRLRDLHTDDLARLAEALLDFKSPSDLERWLDSKQTTRPR